MAGLPILEWTVDYGDERGEVSIKIPHAWQQDVSVDFEGPAIYRTTFPVPAEPSYLRFHAVSYAATVKIDQVRVVTHEGLWDAFDVDLTSYAGKSIDVSVEVVKNGGPTYPVNEVASGFLPYVFNTFGGIYGEVELCEGRPPNPPPAAPSRIRVDGSRLLLDEAPFYMRGILTWGWYPELGHPNVSESQIRREVEQFRSLGFNLVKFCLWIPPHRYLTILREEGMEAWIELPVWQITADADRQAQIAHELRSIVEQYRHHDNVIAWTVGCELGASTSSEYRRQLTQTVRNLTGCPLVRDNSGGAEQYGGDPREYGTFYDFHPYCDTPFFAPVLDSLLPGPRSLKPTLLGETNDIDVHRDLHLLGNELPYWTSNLPELNAQGVRWQHDLPSLVHDSRFSLHPSREGHRALMESSRIKALFMRKTVTEAIRARGEIGGYVVTGARDTPISSSGFLDDWGETRFAPEECAVWNGPACLFVIPSRRPPWYRGGNRPGYVDPYNLIAGHGFWKIGIHSEADLRSGLLWNLVREDGSTVLAGAEEMVAVEALRSVEVGQIFAENLLPGNYELRCEFAAAKNAWPIWVVEPLHPDWTTGRLGFDHELGDARPGLTALHEGPVIEAPFWREAAYEFPEENLPINQRWSRLLPIAGDSVLDMNRVQDAFQVEGKVLIRRIDTRNYREGVVLARFGDRFVTTLRPEGGLGIQPVGRDRNPAGIGFLNAIRKQLTAE